MTRKYRNVPTVVDGMRFDSKAEARRWGELKLLQKAGYIHDLQRQHDWTLAVNGRLVGRYRSDFEYRDADGLVVEDVKSPASRTAVYRLKRKLMVAIHGIRIREVST